MLEEHGPSGLTVMRESADHASVQDALRAHDPELRLAPQFVNGQTVWMVFRYRGGDRPAETVCSWRDENLEALPLSHGLVEMVKRLDRNTRGRQEDPDLTNARRAEKLLDDDDTESEEMARDFERRAKRHPAFHRGVHLRRGDRLGRL